MDGFDNSIKQEKRDNLRVIRNKNIYRAIGVLIVFMIILGIVNKYYQEYRQSVMDDQWKIASMNSYFYAEFYGELAKMTEMMDEILTESDIGKSEKLYRQNLNLNKWFSYIKYDVKLYSINSMDSSMFLEDCQRIIQSIYKAGEVSQSEKKILEQIQLMTQELVKVRLNMFDTFRGSEMQEELRYLYYYKGELYYQMSNVIAVYSKTIDFGY